MFERLDRIHYDFLKNLMIFTKIHVFVCLNWGEKQLSQLAKFENWTILKFQSLQFSVLVQQFGVITLTEFRLPKLIFGQFQRLEI